MSKRTSKIKFGLLFRILQVVINLPLKCVILKGYLISMGRITQLYIETLLLPVQSKYTQQ